MSKKLNVANGSCATMSMIAVPMIAVALITATLNSGPLLTAQENLQPADALQTIESERGGRHWIDQATDPPMSPQDSLASMRIEDGYEIELVASEPLVQDPVAIAFDQRGRMFVAEFSDYPEGPDQGNTPLSKIVLLDDTDGDGRPDKRIVFADQLDFANSLMPYWDGLIVGAKDQILFLADRDGDDVAEIRTTLFSGFTPAHPQMQISNPRWGIDNRIYLNYGPGKVRYVPGRGLPVALARKDFWFDWNAKQFGSDSGLGQYGNTIDRWGNRFYCLNRNPIMATFLSPEVIARNPYHVVRHSFYDVGKAGGATRVYPLVEMKSNYLSHAGTHTAACGTTAYIGDLGDESYRNSVFVCEPIGHLVTRSVIEPRGIKLNAKRAEPKRDFLASTDAWFRPSSLACGPGGGLYLADMYRLWVEHPKFLPPEIADKLDWRAGADRGRIYRIVPAGAQRRPFEPPQLRFPLADHPTPVEQYVALLADPDGWRQSLGQQLLVQYNFIKSVPLIRKLLVHPDPTTRLRAAWTLRGMRYMVPKSCLIAINDQDPHLRVAGIRLSEKFLDQPQIFQAISDRAVDPDIRVRFQVALSLAVTESPQASDLLISLAIRDGGSADFTDGLLTSTKNRSGQILAAVVADDRVDSTHAPLVQSLAAVVGARGDAQELAESLTLISSASADDVAAQWWQIAAIGGLGRGLARHRGELGRVTLASLIADPPASMQNAVSELEDCLSRYQVVAAEADSDLATRVAAIELLGFQSIESTMATHKALLRETEAGEIQRASVLALANRPSMAVSQLIVDAWDQLRPSVRGVAIGLMLRRTDTTTFALDAIDDRKIDRSVLSIDQRVALLKHSDPSIRRLATKLLGGAISENRREVVDQYQSALNREGSAAAGKLVFNRVCAACHRRDGEGNEVGPDLSDVRNRSKATLLYEILDPNAKVEPRFGSYSILTVEGQVFNGLLATETDQAVVLTLSGGQQQTIGRAEIERMRVSSTSLMPEGIEKEVDAQQMADLLEFLKAGS